MVRAEHQFRRKIRNLTFDNAGVAEREKDKELNGRNCIPTDKKYR